MNSGMTATPVVLRERISNTKKLQVVSVKQKLNALLQTNILET